MRPPTPVPLQWSDADPGREEVVDPIEATPGSDTALKRPENLRVTRSDEDNEGRTGLILSWDKATTVRDADGDTVDALGYRIEYSDSGLLEEGYDWRVLQDVFVPLDDDW